MVDLGEQTELRVKNAGVEPLEYLLRNRVLLDLVKRCPRWVEMLNPRILRKRRLLVQQLASRHRLARAVGGTGDGEAACLAAGSDWRNSRLQ